MKTATDAKQLLEDLDLFRVPVRPKEVCSKLDIIYDEKPYSGFDGLLLVEGSRQLIGVSSKINEESRKSFTCAHELGHYHYDIAVGGLIKCSRDDVGYGKQSLNEKEKRANQFASDLLLPTDFFLADIRGKAPSWDLIQALASRYETSLQATASRFVALTHHTCWLVISKAGKLQRFVKAEHNEFLIDLNRTYRPARNKSKDWISVCADNWLYDCRRVRDKELLLWPLTENQYGESLMLLWDDGDTLQNDYFESDEENDGDDEDRDGYRW